MEFDCLFYLSINLCAKLQLIFHPIHTFISHPQIDAYFLEALMSIISHHDVA